ncbi:MAG: hypothetical protein ACYTEZ_07575 [Planctomycetota bacterium]|jgi:hypothetical protein
MAERLSGEGVPPVDWAAVKERLPSTAHELVDELGAAWREGAEDPARAVERRLRERLGELKRRFAALKSEASA